MNIVEVPIVDKEVEIYEPECKRIKTDYCSENSVSLPGIIHDAADIDTTTNTTTIPVGFEPGMFKQEETDVQIITTDTETIIQTETHTQDVNQESQQSQSQSQPPTQQKVILLLFKMVFASF